MRNKTGRAKPVTPKALRLQYKMKYVYMKVRKLRNNSKDGIWLEPKYYNNGCLVAKFRIGKGQTTIS